MEDHRASLDLQREESLPWLEPAQGWDDPAPLSPVRIAILGIGIAVVAAALWWGVGWVRDNPRAGGPELIAAPQTPYKIPAEDSASRQFEGEGDASYAASEGIEPEGRLDISKLDEQPAAAITARTAEDRATEQGDTAQTPEPAETPAPPSNRLTVQLGAYGSTASANAGWASLKMRFPGLAAFSPQITRAVVGGGTVYRLRTSSANEAALRGLCETIQERSENCIVIR